MLNNSGESGHPCLVSDVEEPKLKFLPLRMMVTYLVVQWLRIHTLPPAAGKSLIPGWGTEIPQASRCSQTIKKKKKEYISLDWKMLCSFRRILI